MSEVVSRRYAQALMDVVPNKKAIDQVASSLDRFVAAAHGGEGDDAHRLADVLESPVFTGDERRAVLNEVLGKLELHPLAANLLRLASDKRRMRLVPAIADAFRALADKRAGRVRVTVETAEPLTPQLEAEVRAALEEMTGQTVVVRTEVRPELIAGLVARIGDKVYDSSLRTRLQLIELQLLNSPIAQA